MVKNNNCLCVGVFSLLYEVGSSDASERCARGQEGREVNTTTGRADRLSIHRRRRRVVRQLLWSDERACVREGRDGGYHTGRRWVESPRVGDASGGWTGHGGGGGDDRL